MSYNILLVEDERDIASLIAYHLQSMSNNIMHLDRGAPVQATLMKDQWDLVILDLRLPDSDGIEICANLRELDRDLAIILISAKASNAEILEGFEAGADDYIVKPFRITELVARTRALLRRSVPPKFLDAQQDLVFGDLAIEPDKHMVLVSGEPKQLTKKEFQLLMHFVSFPGRVFNRDDLLSVIWGDHYKGYAHTVNSHINRLRQKIEPDPREPRYIQTLWGIGYKFIHPGRTQAV